MDNPTRALVSALRERDKLRAALSASDRTLTAALRDWSSTRPGAVRGHATEAGARFLLRQAGLL